ncbi:hypothetical protein COB72_09335 [bacterium]|nr:MAG: hypothetical protein COB72_09335 [bacterium]
MSESKIEWTGETWEVTAGCSRVSDGCANCYAETLVGTRFAGMARRRQRDGVANGSVIDVSLKVVNEKTGKWNGHIELLVMNLEQPIKRKKPTVYFVNSRSDLFHPDVPFEYIDRVFAVMALTPQHRYQVLTKRPERMAMYFVREENIRKARQERDDMGCWPLSNVWLGTSVENQAVADERVPHLLACPVSEGAGRFLSVEPLLGEVDLDGHLKSSTRIHMCVDVRGAIRNKSFDGVTRPDGSAMTRCEAEDAFFDILATGVKVVPMGSCDDFDDQTGCRGHRTPGIDWVIVGGESGKDARACRVDWIRSIIEQCKAASVPVFVKQLGKHPLKSFNEEACEGYAPRLHLKDHKGADMSEWPEDLRVREVPDGLKIGGEEKKRSQARTTQRSQSSRRGAEIQKGGG